jgi:alkylation response protein AidB-like acyl-CoA dehydrogenase
VDFTFSEEQQAAVEAARAALSDAAPDGGSLPSPAVGGEPIAEDLDRELWQRLCKSDLTGIALAEEYGGGGQSVLAWALVLACLVGMQSLTWEHRKPAWLVLLLAMAAAAIRRAPVEGRAPPRG